MPRTTKITALENEFSQEKQQLINELYASINKLNLQNQNEQEQEKTPDEIFEKHYKQITDFDETLLEIEQKAHKIVKRYQKSSTKKSSHQDKLKQAEKFSQLIINMRTYISYVVILCTSYQKFKIAPFTVEDLLTVFDEKETVDPKDENVTLLEAKKFTPQYIFSYLISALQNQGESFERYDDENNLLSAPITHDFQVLSFFVKKSYQLHLQRIEDEARNIIKQYDKDITSIDESSKPAMEELIALCRNDEINREILATVDQDASDQVVNQLSNQAKANRSAIFRLAEAETKRQQQLATEKLQAIIKALEAVKNQVISDYRDNYQDIETYQKLKNLIDTLRSGSQYTPKGIEPILMIEKNEADSPAQMNIDGFAPVATEQADCCCPRTPPSHYLPSISVVETSHGFFTSEIQRKLRTDTQALGLGVKFSPRRNFSDPLLHLKTSKSTENNRYTKSPLTSTGTLFNSERLSRGPENDYQLIVTTTSCDEKLTAVASDPGSEATPQRKSL